MTSEVFEAVLLWKWKIVLIENNILTTSFEGEYMEEEYLTVSQVNAYINRMLKGDMNLKNIHIKGEISNYKTYPSGHSYFTLKDEDSQIPAVMFKGRKYALKFTPENGMKVIVKGSINVYDKAGRYQLLVASMTEDGVGNLHIAYEQLKKKLEAEGLFDDAHKKKFQNIQKGLELLRRQPEPQYEISLQQSKIDIRIVKFCSSPHWFREIKRRKIL